MRRLLAAGVVSVALVGAPSAAQASTASPPPPASSPQAVAACPICIPAAIGAIRAATVIRGAAAARTLAAAAARARSGFNVKSSQIRIAVRQSRTVARRSRTWVRKNWGNLSPNTRACLRGGALLAFGKYADEGVVTRTEWKAYTNFTYPGLPPIGEIYFNPAFSFDEVKEIAVVGCAAGLLERRSKLPGD